MQASEDAAMRCKSAQQMTMIFTQRRGPAMSKLVDESKPDPGAIIATVANLAARRVRIVDPKSGEFSAAVHGESEQPAEALQRFEAQPRSDVSGGPPNEQRVFERRRGVVDLRIGPKQLRRRLMLADVVAVTAGLGLAFLIQELVRPVVLQTRDRQIILALFALPVWIFANAGMRLYRSRANLRARAEWHNIVSASAIATGIILGLGFGVGFEALSRLWIALVFFCVTTLMTMERALARRAFRRARARKRIARRVLIVGADEHAVELSRRLMHNPELGYEPCGFIAGGDEAIAPGAVLLGGLDDIEQVAIRERANGVMVSLFSVSAAEVNELSRRLTDEGLHVSLISSLQDIDVGRLLTYDIDGQAMFYVEPTVRTGWRRAAEWCFDKTVACVGLLVSLPILVVAAIAIKVNSRGPILFRQLRIGIGGAPFEILKLRTMVVDAEDQKASLMSRNESDGPLFKMSSDPRVTSVGRTLRKLSFDEFPQFWNVLRGDMSIVGPRPALPKEVESWSEELHERLRVLPGITGLWQVSGRSESSFENYKRLDLYYVDNWSLLHDLRIVARTLVAVVKRDGAH